MEVEQLATVMGMVRAGLGVSLVPALSLAYFQDPGIAIRRLEGLAPQRTIYWVRHRHQGLGPAAQAFYDSPEYLTAREARAGAAIMRMVCVEGV